VAVTWFNNYVLQAGTVGPTALNPPASTAAGDLEVLWCANKLSSAVPTLDSTTWSLLGSQVVGTGSDGVDTGPIRITAWWRILTGTSTTTNLSLSGGSAFIAGGGVFRKAAGDPPWHVAIDWGSDTSSGTGFTATMATGLQAVSGDFVYSAGAFSANTTISTRSITTTGLTATVTGIDSGGNASGNHLFVWTDRAAGTAGTLTAPSATTATAGVATTGGAINVRVAAYWDAQYNPPDTYLPDSSLLSPDAADAGDPTLGLVYRAETQPEALDDQYPRWQKDGYSWINWAASSGTSKSLPIPATAKAGHLAIAVVAVNGTASNDISMSGWTRKYQTTLTGWGDTFAMMAILYRTLQPGDIGTNATITLGAQPRGGASLHTFANAETTLDPFEDPQFNESTSSGQPPTLTVTPTGRVAIFAAITNDTNSITATEPGLFTRRHVAAVSVADAGHVAVRESINAWPIAHAWVLSATNRNNTWSAAIKSPAPTTNAPAECANVTAQANDATIKVAPGAENAAVAAQANDATVTTVTGGTNAPAENAAVSVVAQQPTIIVAPGAQVANATVSANQPTIKVSPGAQVANATVVAEQPTIKVSPGSQVANATVVAEQPTPRVSTNAGNAAVAAAALQPTIKVAPGAQVANVTTAANQPTTSIATGAGVANAATVANDPSRKVSPGSEVAPVNATANDATISLASFTNANAQVANVAAAANGPAMAVAPTPATAAVAVSTASAPSIAPHAALVAVTVAANQPSRAVSPGPPAANVAAAALGSGQRVSTSAQLAAVLAAANDITSVVPPSFKHLAAVAVGPRFKAQAAPKNDAATASTPRKASTTDSQLSATTPDSGKYSAR
jgi:hypothetical protein